MSWTYINKHGVRVLGTSNGYYRLEVTDDVEGTSSSVEFLPTEAPIMREIAKQLLIAADHLEIEG